MKVFKYYYFFTQFKNVNIEKIFVNILIGDVNK